MVIVRLAWPFNNRDKYRERFDIPDHPLWESLQLNGKCSSTIMRKYSYMARSKTTDDSNQTSDTQIASSYLVKIKVARMKQSAASYNPCE